MISLSEKRYGSKIGVVHNFPYFLVSALLLLLSFTDPKSKWLVSFEFLGFTGLVDVYRGLFVFCMALYIPMMAFVFCFFVRAIAGFVKSKNFQGGIYFIVASAVGVIALYRFDHWVFSEIF